MKLTKPNPITLLLPILLIFTTCGKKVENVNKEYLGTWIKSSYGGTSTRSLTITDDRNSEYKECVQKNTATFCPYGTCYECEVKVSGRARIKNGKLDIGSTKFKIDQEPTYGSVGIYMKLDGETWTKTSTDGSCNDGIKNQNETDVDCGGLCSACVSCSDNIKNQDETAVDCGGATCDACFTGFSYNISSVMGGGTGNYTASVVDASYHSGTFRIKVDLSSTHQSMILEFNAASTGTYSFNSATYVVPGTSYGTYYIDPTASGSITISALDLTSRKMSATFYFTGKNPGATSPVSPYCNVSSSSFANLKYYLN